MQPYTQFYKATWQKDAETVARVVREHPELHDYEGRKGSLLFILETAAPELFETAFAAGLSPDSGEEKPHITFLQSAICVGDIERIRMALRYGADPERPNHVGELALAYACTWGQLEAVQILVLAGAQVNAVEENPENGRRNTALDCTSRYPEIAQFLRSRGALHLDELEPSSVEGSGV